jgi:hypothetical protein
MQRIGGPHASPGLLGGLLDGVVLTLGVLRPIESQSLFYKPFAEIGFSGGTYSSCTRFRKRDWSECQMSDTVPGVSITHPEEMLGGFDLHIGKNINLKGSGRITPAGIVTVGLMTVAIFLAATALVRAARQ